jgi:hypothetical protein
MMNESSSSQQETAAASGKQQPAGNWKQQQPAGEKKAWPVSRRAEPRTMDCWKVLCNDLEEIREHLIQECLGPVVAKKTKKSRDLKF